MVRLQLPKDSPGKEMGNWGGAGRAQHTDSLGEGPQRATQGQGTRKIGMRTPELGRATEQHGSMIDRVWAGRDRAASKAPPYTPSSRLPSLYCVPLVPTSNILGWSCGRIGTCYKISKCLLFIWKI